MPRRPAKPLVGTALFVHDYIEGLRAERRLYPDLYSRDLGKKLNLRDVQDSRKARIVRRRK